MLTQPLASTVHSRGWWAFIPVWAVFALPAVALAAEPPMPNWGKLAPVPHRAGQRRATTTPRTDGDALPLPGGGFPQVLRAWRELPEGPRPLTLEYTAAGEPRVLAPAEGAERPIVLETVEGGPQTPDGRWLLLPAQAQLTAPAAVEKTAGHERIVRWAESGEPVAWKFEATRWGRYRAYAIAASEGSGATQVEVSLADTKVEASLPTTGSGLRYVTTDLGRLNLVKAGPQTLALRVRQKTKAAISLLGVVLVPACEGTPPVQAADGTLTLHGQDATVEGTVLRYEPQPKKLTLGYWVRASDAASWQFSVTQPGEFDVEVLQGCGAGQGGSSVLATVGEQELRFEVEDTGHFQNFKPRTIGRVKLTAGQHTLRVGPEKIAKQAALDLRQVRLTPVK